MNAQALRAPAASGKRCRGRRQSGTSLIEVLVTMVLLSLGITSMGTLQVSALKLNHSAYLRSQAAILSYQIIDAMRANSRHAKDGAYDLAFGDPLPTQLAASSSVPAADIRTWQMNVENTMRPFGGQASIQHDGNEFTVAVRWRDRLQEDRDAEQQTSWERFSMVAELR